MDKKSLIILIIAFILIAIIILFGLSNCEPREKIEDESTTEEISYKNAFINANIDFTCQIRKDATILEDKEFTEYSVRESYEKYELPTEDNDKMMKILKEYENNEEITVIIKTHSAPCSTGGDPIFVQ